MLGVIVDAGFCIQRRGRTMRLNLQPFKLIEDPRVSYSFHSLLLAGLKVSNELAPLMTPIKKSKRIGMLMGIATETPV